MVFIFISILPHRYRLYVLSQSSERIRRKIKEILHLLQDIEADMPEDSPYMLQVKIKLKLWIFFKDAGFVYESLRNDTNRVFWDFRPYKSNPRYESFEKTYTKRIHDTNLMKPGLRNESTIRIFWMPYGFANPKYGIRMDSYLFKVRLCTKIREDLWGFVGFVKTGRIFWKLAGFVCTIRYKSFHVRIREPRYDTNPGFVL